MENITGQNNEFTLIFPHNRIDCTSSQNDKFNKIINQANITITGNNNRISMYFDTEESAEELLLSNGLYVSLLFALAGWILIWWKKQEHLLKMKKWYNLMIY